jgi:glyoxylase-like metal-dependent hydrolase (beta-lactamase superfamily II)
MTAAGEIMPGITVHHVGGHTAGLQVARVKTARGWVVLAADASHSYANFEEMRAYATVYNVGDMLEGFATGKRLATSPRHVIPGHDPDCAATPRNPGSKGSRSGSTSRRASSAEIPPALCSGGRQPNRQGEPK